MLTPRATDYMDFQEVTLTTSRTVDDHEVSRIVHEVNSNGISYLPNFLNPSALEVMQKFVKLIVAANGDEYLSLGGTELSNTLFGALSRSDAFIHVMQKVYEKGCKSLLPHQSFYQVLRCLKGQTGLKHSYIFHYDSYLLTALVPIIIPLEGQTGDLMIMKKRRPLRTSYTRNLVDKIFLDNKISQAWLRHRANNQQGPFKRIHLVPGNIYFFWGYRTVHANAPCDPEKIRATALIHYGDPHADSHLRKLTGKAKVRATALG